MHEIFNLYLHQHWTTLGPNVFLWPVRPRQMTTMMWKECGWAEEEDQKSKRQRRQLLTRPQLEANKNQIWGTDLQEGRRVSPGGRTTSMAAAHLAKSILSYKLPPAMKTSFSAERKIYFKGFQVELRIML